MSSTQQAENSTEAESSGFKEQAQIMHQIYALYKSKDFEPSLEYLQSIETSNKIFPQSEIAYLKGKIYFKTGNELEATLIFHSLISSNSPRIIKNGCLYRLGILCKRRMNLETAVGYLEESLKEASSSRHKMKVCCHLGSLYILQNSFSHAENFFNLAVSHLKTEESLACQAWMRLINGATEKSLDSIAGCKVSPTRNPNLYKKLKYILALCLMKKKWFIDALEVLYDIAEGNYLCLTLCGVIFASARQFKDAEAYFEKALTYNEAGWEAYFNLGILKENLSSRSMANQFFLKAKELCQMNLPRDSENFVIPEIDIADYIFEGSEFCLKHQIVKTHKVEQPSRNTLSVQEMSGQSELKPLPMIPLIGLPIVPVDNRFRVSLSFMKNLIAFCHSLAQQSSPQELVEMKIEETGNTSGKRPHTSNSEDQIEKRIKRD